MKKKRKKKRRLKIFILIIFLMAVGSIILFLSKFSVRGYYIVGNTYYSDSEILKKTGLDKYPSFIMTNSYGVSNIFKNDNLIKNIKIKKHLSGIFDVIVNENKILFYDAIAKKSVLEDGKTSDIYYELSPVLINQIDNKKIYNKFIKKFKKLDENIIKNISEIKYYPNEIDKERFLISMNDGNYVYVTLSKFLNINNYLEISDTLGDKNGILYLDYGNYFVPKE